MEVAEVAEEGVKEAVLDSSVEMANFSEASAAVDKAVESGNKKAIDEKRQVEENKAIDVVQSITDKIAERTNTVSADERSNLITFLDNLKSKTDPREASKTINDFENSNSSNSYWKSFKSLVSSGFKSISKLFSSSPEEAKSQIIDDPEAESKKIENKVSELENDKDAKEKAKSSGIDWKIALYILAAGGTIFGLWYASKSCSGCYMKVVGGDSIQLSCSDYYTDDNQQFCSCGSASAKDTAQCESRDLNYPYCKCADTQGKICGNLSKNGDVFYSYKKFNLITVIPEIAKAAGSITGDVLSSFFSGLSGPLKIIFYIFVGILILWLFFEVISIFPSFKEKKE